MKRLKKFFKSKTFDNIVVGAGLVWGLCAIIYGILGVIYAPALGTKALCGSMIIFLIYQMLGLWKDKMELDQARKEYEQVMKDQHDED